MKKTLLIVSLSLVSLQAFSQVEINTTEPKATLDVVGKPLETNVLDGLIVPRITARNSKQKIILPNKKVQLFMLPKILRILRMQPGR
ncbi:hypothetical protein [Epilithonimonas sp.]|uniref:hypothetical protein n=1 Tax=Epilithonimonas sp. TaxID=2894511 RepID=UPI00289717F7|nr:hypothetical protein [Epilithonimonas sp.]